MPDNNPCNGCDERYEACQDTCPKGIAYLKEYHAKKDKTNAAHKLEHDLDMILKGKRRGNWR